MDLSLNSEICPQVNQIEMHPFYQRFYAKQKHTELGVATQSWAYFAEGQNEIFENKILKTIAKKHNKSVAQVILRWLIDRGVAVIPKSINKQRMIENSNIFDFSFDFSDLALISSLDENKSYFVEPRDEKHTEWIIKGYKIINGKAVE